VRPAALTLLGAIIVSSVGVWLSNAKQQDAAVLAEHAQRARDAAASRYAQVDNEKRDIRNFQHRFVELRQRGLIGEERRLEWLDAIRQTQTQLKLPPLSYEIEPQQVVTLETPLDLGEYQLRAAACTCTWSWCTNWTCSTSSRTCASAASWQCRTARSSGWVWWPARRAPPPGRRLHAELDHPEHGAESAVAGRRPPPKGKS
jgi:hypothetical protein